MADIRLVRPRGSRVWLWVLLFCGVSLVVLLGSAWLGDPTEVARSRGAGAKAGFGSNRAPVIPAVVTPFENVRSLGEGDIGRLVRVEGWAVSPLRGNSVWVRTADNRRILVRYEPLQPGNRPTVYAGGRFTATGYLQRIARAELQVRLDSLGVRLPKPPPSQKFGDLPDSGFIKVDRLFVKTFYVSVRPTPGAAAVR